MRGIIVLQTRAKHAAKATLADTFGPACSRIVPNELRLERFVSSALTAAMRRHRIEPVTQT